MKQYDYILLDWDGNLAKTLDLWLNIFRQVLDEEGFYPTDEEIAGSFGKTDEFFAKIGVKDPEGLYERADQIGRKRLPNVELYPDALEVLQYFKDQNKATALITASNRANVEGLLDHYNMRNLFDVFIAREDITKQKPDPESLNIAMERLNADPARTVMIGDSDKDVGAAANAGIDSILFYPPEHKKFYDFEKLKQLQPTHIVDDSRQIMKIVR
jgi:pyrophosphatase PpaX